MPMPAVACAFAASCVLSAIGWGQPPAPQALLRGPEINACAATADGKLLLFSCRPQKAWEIRRWALPPVGMGSGIPAVVADTELITEGFCPLPFAGKLLFARRGAQSGGLWVRDLASGEEKQLRRDPFFGLPPAISSDGSVIMISRWAGKSKRIGVVDPASGKYASLPGNDMSQPALNTSGDKLLFVRGGHVWLRDLRSAQEQQLTTDEAEHSWPAWCPDGRSIAFCARSAKEEGNVGVMDLGSRQVRWVATRMPQAAAPTFSPDGLSLLFLAAGAVERERMVMRVPVPLLSSL